jgi:outer membrane protein, heavy metal efflux system
MLQLISVSATKRPTTDRLFVVARTWAKVCVLLAILGLYIPVNAAEVGGRPLTLQDAVTRSLIGNPDLAGYAHRVQSAEGQAVQAGTATPPELRLEVEDALGTGEYSEFDSSQTTLSIGWILEQPLLEKRVLVAQSNRSVVDVNHEVLRYDIAAQTARDFLAVLAFQERLSLANYAQRHAQDILAEVTRRVDAAVAPPADQLKAEVNVERRALEVEDIEHELISAKRQLAAQWGATTVEFDQVAGTLGAGLNMPPYNEMESAITNNPAIRFFLTQERMAESEIALASAESRPQWQFSAGVRRLEATDDYGVIASVSFPLGGSNRNQGKISALTADKSRIQGEAYATEIKLKTRLFVLYQELQHFRHIGDALEQRIIPRLERALAQTRKAYQAGKYSYLELAAIQQELLEARFALIDVGLSSQLNLVEVERLTGQSIPASSEEK